MESTLRKARGLVSKKKRRFQDDGFDLDLTYVTPNIIAMGYPSSGAEAMYRNPLPQVQTFFDTRHKGKFRLYNLCSERAYPVEEFGGNVARFPFDDHNPCPLDMIGKFCADVDEWLGKDADNVAAIHCKAGKGRTGLMVSAYLVHSHFKGTAQEGLNYFGEVRTANSKGVTIPSQMRYVHYYERVLQDGLPPTPTYQITHIRLNTVPNFGGGCDAYFAIFLEGRKAFDYKEEAGKTVRGRRKTDLHLDFDLTSHKVLITKDVKLQLYHLESGGKKKKMCHLWFNTGYIESTYLYFTKPCIDKACKKKSSHKFDDDFSIEIYVHKVADDEAVKVSAAAEVDEVDTDDTDTDDDEVAAAKKRLSEQQASAADVSVSGGGGGGAGGGAGSVAT